GPFGLGRRVVAEGQRDRHQPDQPLVDRDGRLPEGERRRRGARGTTRAAGHAAVRPHGQRQQLARGRRGRRRRRRPAGLGGRRPPPRGGRAAPPPAEPPAVEVDGTETTTDDASNGPEAVPGKPGKGPEAGAGGTSTWSWSASAGAGPETSAGGSVAIPTIPSV